MQGTVGNVGYVCRIIENQGLTAAGSSVAKPLANTMGPCGDLRLSPVGGIHLTQGVQPLDPKAQTTPNIKRLPTNL